MIAIGWALIEGPGKLHSPAVGSPCEKACRGSIGNVVPTTAAAAERSTIRRVVWLVDLIIFPPHP
jgi:hypothetical protein